MAEPATAVGTAPRAVRYGRAPLLALAFGQFLEAGERQSLAQAVDGIQERFSVSDTAIGLLAAAMVAVAVVGAFPMGILADRMRRTWLLAVALVIWTVCMGLNALSTGFVFLFLTRMGVGAVEANNPAALSLLSDYYPVRDRARMMGLYQSGALAGALLGLIGGGVVVGIAGWRWAFAMWLPLGLLGAAWIARQPEPARGEQDADFGDEVHERAATADTEIVELSAIGAATLPSPARAGQLDYATATPREVFRELLRIPTMWFGVLSLTISALLLNGVQFWAVEYFKRTHDLSAAAAGAVTALLGAGSVLGVLGGGVLSDRLLARGVLNARVYVVAWGSILATAALVPAFASSNLFVTAPLFFAGGLFLTLPLAPAEALVSDVVVAELRGRAASVRSVVRALAAVGPLVIGVLADLMTLRWAMVAITPVYGLGGVIMFAAARHYPADVAFVVAESLRLRALRGNGVTGPDGAAAT